MEKTIKVYSEKTQPGLERLYAFGASGVFETLETPVSNSTRDYTFTKARALRQSDVKAFAEFIGNYDVSDLPGVK